MAHWLDGVARILRSSDLNIINLARLADIDPTDVYQYADLSQCDLRGQDLRGIDLTGATLEGALIDGSTRIDEKFDPRIYNKGYFTFRINARLVRYVNSEAHYAGYTYAIWFAKYLFEMMYNIKDSIQFNTLLNDLFELDLSHFFSLTEERSVRRTIQIPNYIKNWISDFQYGILEDEKYSFLIFASLLFRIQYSHNSLSSTLEELINREDAFRKSRNYLSGF